jgi:hypothetical protein
LDFNFHPDTNPDEKFSILKNLFFKLVAKHKDSLKELKSPYFTLPKENVLDFSNLKLYSTSLTRLGNGNFEFFKNGIAKFEKHGFPKTISIKNINQESDVSKYIMKHFKENLLSAKFSPGFSFQDKVPGPKFLPVKYFELCGFRVLAKNDWMELPWTFGGNVQYLKISFCWFDPKDPKYDPKWENFELLMQNLPNLKEICVNIYDINSSKIPIESISPLYESYLKNRGIKILNTFEFDENVQELSKKLTFSIHLDSYSF